MPSSRQATITRSAISPRLAIRIFLNTRLYSLPRATARRKHGEKPKNSLRRLQREQPLTVLHSLPVVHVTLDDLAVALGIDLVHQLHRLDDAQNLPFPDRIADLGIRLGAGLRRAVERADDRRLHDRQV